MGSRLGNFGVSVWKSWCGWELSLGEVYVNVLTAGQLTAATLRGSLCLTDVSGHTAHVQELPLLHFRKPKLIDQGLTSLYWNIETDHFAWLLVLCFCHCPENCTKNVHCVQMVTFTAEYPLSGFSLFQWQYHPKPPIIFMSWPIRNTGTYVTCPFSAIFRRQGSHSFWEIINCI